MCQENCFHLEYNASFLESMSLWNRLNLQKQAAGGFSKVSLLGGKFLINLRNLQNDTNRF